jgi:hypothetical protein
MSKTPRSNIEKIGIAFASTAAAAGAVVGLSHNTAPPKASRPADAVALAGHGSKEYSETVRSGSSLWAIGAAALKAEGIPATDANVNNAKITLEDASGTASNAGNVEVGQNFNFDTTHPVIHPEYLKAVGAEPLLPVNNKQNS